MRRCRRSAARGVVCLAGTLFTLLAVTPPASSSAASRSKEKALTGRYQLYCPDPVETPIVLHAKATARIAPAAPAPGRRFAVSGFQTVVTFPEGVASALAQMSPIVGKVTGTVLVVGATPRSLSFVESFVATIPRSVPASGFNFSVPLHPAGLGAFTARSRTLAVEEASRFILTLTVGHGKGADTRVLTCTAFPNATRDFELAQPWVGTKEPPLAQAITPVIALGR